MKSHVSMGMLQCRACGTTYESGEILLDRQMKPSLERETVVGLGLCPEHSKDGYITMLGVEDDGETLTGDLIHLKDEAFTQVLGQPIPESRTVRADKELIQHLKDLCETIKPTP